MAKKKVGHDEIAEAISTGATACPDCGAEWTKPLNGKGKEIKNPPNLVLLHTDDCAWWDGIDRG